MPFSVLIIISLVGGLILAVVIKLLFNLISGRNATDFSDLADFFRIFLGCAVIVFLVIALASCEACVSSGM